MINHTESVETRYIPVGEWNKFHPWPPVGGLRHLIFYRDTNGFKSAFKHVGKRVLIDEKAFFRCLEAQNKGAK